MSVAFDVVIVGYGPTGATLANLLGMHGHRVLVLERETEAYHLPRAVHFDEEIMRVFQTIGLAHQVDSIARVNPGMRFVDDNGQLLLDWPRPAGIGRGGWHSSYRFHQPDLEHVLRNGLERFANVTVRSRTEFIGAVDLDGVQQVTFTDLSRDQSEQVSTRYLVGCDGGRSTVRQLMQTDTEDLGFRESWLVVDVMLHEPMPQLGDYTIQYCNAKQPATYVRCPENRRRWEIAMPPGISAEAMSQPEHVWHLLKDWLQPAQASLERAAVYTFHSMIAKQWRCGRTLIAGDAAHQMPPFMGQGMCAGIRDVANLGWKLHQCIRLGDCDQLLDSYQSERLPHVRAYIETAIRLGRLLNSSETEQALRSAMAEDDGTPTMKSIAPGLGPGLFFSNSPANGVADSGCARGDFAGTIAPQAVHGGCMLDDVVGYHPLLLIDDKLLDEVDEGTLRKVHVEPVRARGQIAEILADLNATAILVRPDRYIYGCANSVDELVDLLNSAKCVKVIEPGE